MENLRVDLQLGYLSGYSDYSGRNDGVDQWLELLRPFTAVKSLYLSWLGKFQPNLASALQELAGGRTTEILPSLQNIFLEMFEPSRAFHEAIGQFVATRGHPIAVLLS
jgi:hypothetical protein